MGERIAIPTEGEWQIMEVVWARQGSITSSDIVKEIQKSKDISKTTIRVNVKNLVEKGLLDYTVDDHDSRVFHYTARLSRKECQKYKSKEFVNHYFKGSKIDAIAALASEAGLSKKELDSLKDILKRKNTDDGDGTTASIGSK